MTKRSAKFCENTPWSTTSISSGPSAIYYVCKRIDVVLNVSNSFLSIGYTDDVLIIQGKGNRNLLEIKTIQTEKLIHS